MLESEVYQRRSPSDHTGSLLERVPTHGKQTLPDSQRLFHRDVAHLRGAGEPQPQLNESSAILHSKCISRSVTTCLRAHAHSRLQNSQDCSREQLCHSYATATQHQSGGYQTLISPAAQQRLERLSRRHDELCQRLSGRNSTNPGKGKPMTPREISNMHSMFTLMLHVSSIRTLPYRSASANQYLLSILRVYTEHF